MIKSQIVHPGELADCKKLWLGGDASWLVQSYCAGGGAVGST